MKALSCIDHLRRLRLLIAIVAAVVLSGCVSYYDRYYGDSGVYYGGYETSYYRPAAPPLNPVVYPYWSLDYFYFSRYHHPYSVFVGYHEPLYYPYPGWIFGGYYAAHRYGYRPGLRASLGFGYPWYGFGHLAPRFSLGFFAGSGYYRGYGGYGHRPYRHPHRLRDIDQRLRELQYPASAPSRTALVSRDRDSGRSSIRQTGARSNLGQPSRAAMLRDDARRVSPSGAFQSRRSASGTSSRLQQRGVVSPRNDLDRTTDRSRLMRQRDDRSASRDSGVRSTRFRSARPAELRRQQLQTRSRSTSPNTTSDRRAAPSSSAAGQGRPVSAPPARSTRAPSNRIRTAPPVRSQSPPRRAAPPPQRSRPDRVVRPRNDSAPRARVRSERSGPSRAARGPVRDRNDRSRRPDRGRLRDRLDRLD